MARIIIAEDDGIVAMDFEMLLTSAGHEVCGVAATAAEAITLAATQRPDVILMDGGLAHGTSGIFATAIIVRR